MPKKYTTLMVTCVDPKLKRTIYLPAEDCIIGYDKKGDYIKVKNLLEFCDNQKDRIDMLEAKHNELVSKYNALLAAYKANVAKTAMQLLDLEEHN